MIKKLDDNLTKMIVLSGEAAEQEMVIMLLTIAGVCYLLAQSLTKPIRKLQQTARMIADGDYSAMVANSLGRAGNEITDLGREFDIMIDRTEQVITSQKRLL